MQCTHLHEPVGCIARHGQTCPRPQTDQRTHPAITSVKRKKNHPRKKCFSLFSAKNIHRNHILHLSLSPARISTATAAEARALALGIAEKIGLIGLLAVEMFVQDGRIVVNELAPRPHNSGHQTFDANETSQFEQHIRAVCGLPLGGTKPLQPSVMLNLLGDLWKNGQEPDWTLVLADPAAKLHLYDKGKAAPGRKMGHVTVTAPTLEEALRRAEGLFATLSA